MAHMEDAKRPAATPQDFARRNAPQSGDGASGMFGNAAQAVKNKAREMAEEQKSAGAARMDSLGRAVHEAADELGKEIPVGASYIHSAADSLQSASQRLRESSVGDIASRIDG